MDVPTSGPLGSATKTQSASKRPRVLLVVPAFNESASICATLEAASRDCSDADVVVVDDGSEDDTAQAARSTGAMVVQLPFNVGIGGAVQTGFQYAVEHGYDVVVQIDGDGQHPPSEVARLVAPVLEGSCEVAIGSRFLARGAYQQTWPRSVGIAILARVLSLVAHQRVTDPTSGFRAYTRAAVEYLALDYPYDYPEPEVLVMLSRAGFQFREVPVQMLQRRNGVSSINRFGAVTYMSKVLLAVVLSVLRPAPAKRPVQAADGR